MVLSSGSGRYICCSRHGRTGMKTLYKIAVGAHVFKHCTARAGHDEHVEHNVDGVCQLNAVFGKRAAYNAHGIGNYVHRFSA